MKSKSNHNSKVGKIYEIIEVKDEISGKVKHINKPCLQVESQMIQIYLSLKSLNYGK